MSSQSRVVVMEFIVLLLLYSRWNDMTTQFSMSAAASAQKTKIRVYKIVVLGDGGVGKSGMCTVGFVGLLGFRTT